MMAAFVNGLIKVMRSAAGIAEAAEKIRAAEAERAARAVQGASAAPRAPIIVSPPPPPPPAAPVRTASDMRRDAAAARQRQREAAIIAQGRAMADRLVAEVLARANNAARIATLRGRVQEASERIREAQRRYSIAWRAAQEAEAAVAQAILDAHRRFEAEKLRPLIEARDRARGDFDDAERDLARHRTAGPIQRIGRAWRAEDTRLRQVLASARVVLDEAKLALARMRDWLSGEGGRRGRAAAEQTAREQHHREVVAPALARRDEAQQALRQTREERRAVFQELRAAETELGIETGEIAPRPPRKTQTTAPVLPPADPKAPGGPAWR